MKRTLLLWLACLLVLTVFAGCVADPQLPEDAGTGTESTPESTDAPQTTVGEPAITENEYIGEGFQMEGQKYVYHGDDVLILHVKNVTDTDYDIEITVTFYDENGVKTLRHQKSFAGFAAQWENYFVFLPEKPFEFFRCTIEKTESTDTAYSAYLSQGTGEDALRFLGASARRWRSPEGVLETFDEEHFVIRANYQVLNSGDQLLYFTPVFVLFDKDGQIYTVDTGLDTYSLSPANKFTDILESIVPRPVYRSEEPWSCDIKGMLSENDDEFQEALPDALKGDISFIVSFLAVDDESTSVWK